MNQNENSGILFRLFLYLKDKFDPKPVVPEEVETSTNIVLKVLDYEDTELVYAPVSNKRFIVNEDKGMAITIENRVVHIINHVYSYSIYMENNECYSKILKKFSKKIPILKAGNMSLGVNLLMYLTEIASKSLNDEYLSKVFEVHHKHKKDYPSGTALMLGKGIADGKNKNLYNLMGKKFLNKKSFPYGKKINFNSIRKGEIIGEHEVTFSSGKEIIKLNHEAFDRALYSDGALTAAKWLINKKPGLYSMRDLLNFK